MSCEKVKMSYDEAVKALAGFKADKRPSKKNLRSMKHYYFCDECNAYHLTSMDNHKKREKHEITTTLTTGKQSNNNKMLHIKNYSSTPVCVK